MPIDQDDRLDHDPLRRRLNIGLGAALAAVLTGGLAGRAGAATADDWDAVVAAAKKEGKVTIYNGTNFPIVRKIADKFRAKYGIAAEVLDGRASEINERVRTEQAAGRHIGDITYSGLTTLTVEKSEGRFQPHGMLPNGKNVDPAFPDDGTITQACIGNFAILVNTNLVKPGEIKSWKDLTDPKWKGKILSDDPRAAGAGEVWFEVTYNHFGLGYHEKMAAQHPVFSRVYAESERRVARGEYPVYLPYNISETPKLKGLPVQPLIPVEGVPYVGFAGATLKDAPHPNAARLFLNFLLDDEPQLMQAREGFRPAITGMDDKVPPELRPYTTGAKLLGTTRPDARNKMMKLAQGIYK